MNKKKGTFCRLTDEERESLLKECKELGFSNLSLYIRSLILPKEKKGREHSSSISNNKGNELKKCNVQIRFTEDEYNRLKSENDVLKYSGLSAYLRFLISSKEVKINFSPTDEELSRSILENNRLLKSQIFQMSKIGTNINQVVKSINTQNIIGKKEIVYLSKRLDEIYKLLESNQKK